MNFRLDFSNYSREVPNTGQIYNNQGIVMNPINKKSLGNGDPSFVTDKCNDDKIQNSTNFQYIPQFKPKSSH